jgi:hypothetical protein
MLVVAAQRTAGRRVNQLKRRSCCAMLAPIIIFAGFGAAGVFISEVSGKAYESNDVLIRSGRCGNWAFNTKTIEGSRAWQLKIVNDTVAGRAYARNCYGSNITISKCSFFPVQAIPYNQSSVSCPFQTDASGQGLCIYGNNNAFQLDTGLLDTNTVFGINAPKQNRLQIRRRATCSPIHARDYVNLTTDASLGVPIWQFFLGPIAGVSDWTYQYNTHTRADIVGYQITPVYTIGSDAWTPIQPLQVATGDVSLHFLASNSIAYLSPVQDIWFSANKELNLSANSTATFQNVYEADQFVNVMGCLDQFEICNPNTSPFSCTIIGGLRDVAQAYTQIGLNEYQTATAQRMTPVFAMSSTFNTVNGLGDTALLARDRLVNFIGTGLPDNQWQVEVEGWFQTSLAKMQASVVEYAANVVDLGPFGYINTPNPNGDAIQKAAASFCSNQRVRNVGSYQSFSFLGVMLVVCVGGVIIVISWSLDRFIEFVRRHSKKNKHDYREIARIADQKL